MQPTAPNCVIATIEADLQNVRRLMREHLNSPGTGISGIVDHILSNSGKMLRPSLVLLGGKCCGSIDVLHVQIATIIELIHITTLLHDDVLDNAQQRRNLPTLNALHGNEAAVLSGDFVFSRVFCLCAELARPDIARIIADTTTHVCHGELEQNLERGNWNLSEARYLEIISAKSASLLGTSCRLGAIASNAGNQYISALEQFGRNLGIAFQITDDVLDIVGDEAKMGKRRGSDLDNKIVTLPVIHMLSTCAPEDRESVFKTIYDSQVALESRANMLVDAGSIEYARKQAREFYEQALGSLSVLPASESRATLIETASHCVDRCS